VQREAPDVRRDGEGNLDEVVKVRLTVDIAQPTDEMAPDGAKRVGAREP